MTPKTSYSWCCTAASAWITKTRQASRNSLDLAAGEFVIVPRGAEHRPVAREEVHVMLFRTRRHPNTGNVRDALTAETLQHI